MSLRHHEIAEAAHRILNPFTHDKLMLLGEVARVGPTTRILDIACGKGELLCQWASVYGSSGHGVDLSEVFLAAARDRADELAVADRVTYTHSDGADFVTDERFDLVSCLGAMWFGGSLEASAAMLKRWAADDAVLLIGEPFWNEEPPPEALAAYDGFTSLARLADRLQATGLELVEMVLADGDSWDRYAASKWWTVRHWLAANPDDAEAPAMRDFLATGRSQHLEFVRRYLGWGVFVLVPAGSGRGG
ncbi:MAG: methyltransferase domain-containing protein [Nocardioidaceae bacterium]